MRVAARSLRRGVVVPARVTHARVYATARRQVFVRALHPSAEPRSSRRWVVLAGAAVGITAGLLYRRFRTAKACGIVGVVGPDVAVTFTATALHLPFLPLSLSLSLCL